MFVLWSFWNFRQLKQEQIEAIRAQQSLIITFLLNMLSVSVPASAIFDLEKMIFVSKIQSMAFLREAIPPQTQPQNNQQMPNPIILFNIRWKNVVRIANTKSYIQKTGLEEHTLRVNFKVQVRGASKSWHTFVCAKYKCCVDCHRTFRSAFQRW